MATAVLCRKFTLDQSRDRYPSLIGYCTHFRDRATLPGEISVYVNEPLEAGKTQQHGILARTIALRRIRQYLNNPIEINILSPNLHNFFIKCKYGKKLSALVLCSVNHFELNTYEVRNEVPRHWFQTLMFHFRVTAYLRSGTGRCAC